MLETDLTPIEVKIMKIIWGCAERLHLKKIQDMVNETFHTDWKPQTISTYLAHLVRKGYLSMERSGKVFLYTAEVSEEVFRTHEANNLIEYFSEFSLIDLLQCFPIETYTHEAISEMIQILDEHDH